jgi:F0F1-type ATP synthase membrane subunit b/b'
MDSIDRLDAAIMMIEEAKKVPLSASVVVHKSEILELLEEARDLLPDDFSQAQKLLRHRDDIIEEGRSSSEQLVALAREEVARMVEQTAIVKEAREESKRILAESREQLDAEREEVDSYIDSRLATLEVILNKTMDAVARGRDRLAGAGDKDVLSQLADND